MRTGEVLTISAFKVWLESMVDHASFDTDTVQRITQDWNMATTQRRADFPPVYPTIIRPRFASDDILTLGPLDSH